jgi:nucleotide-binding universal stress UspA family protein
VVGFIPTEVGFIALDAALEEAQLRGAPLIVVNVVREGAEGDPRFADEGQLVAAHEHLRRAQVRVDIRQESTDEDIADVLLTTAETENAELLVLGIRRRRDIARHLLGVTTQRLLLDSPCEVLVV